MKLHEVANPNIEIFDDYNLEPVYGDVKWKKKGSLEGIPRHIKGMLIASECELTSLKDIHKLIDRIGGVFGGYATFTLNKITSNILGLLLIDGLIKVELDNKVCQAIINKHFGKGKRGMFEAQQELIEAGYPEMAKL